MKTVQALVVSAALAFGMAAPASAGVNDPEVIIYRFAGVVDDGGGLNTGVATVFSCTNFSGATENVRFVTRDWDGKLVSNNVFPVDHLKTENAATHFIRPPYAHNSLATGQVQGGTTAIAATSISIMCTAVITDGGGPLPHGVALRAIRFNPVPGSQE